VTYFPAVDSEYISFGKKAEDDVVNVGVFDGRRAFAYHTPDDFRRWLNTRRPRVLFVWTLRPEFGTFAGWRLLGVDDPTQAVDLESGQIQRFVIWRDRGKTMVLDIQPFFKPLSWKTHGSEASVKLGKLENAAKFLANYYGDPSLVKVQPPPTTFGKEFGQRKPRTPEEWEWYDARVRQDARLTSKAAEFLYTVLLPKFVKNPKPKQFYSWGTVARRALEFPQVNVRMGRRVIVKDLHLLIHESAEFAGRNEAFSIGAIPPSYYLDVKSLYPVSVVASDALRIIDVEPMTRRELDAITKPSDANPYAWLSGSFSTNNDLWGLPARTQERNYYVTGELTGLFHTYDLEAAKAEIRRLDFGLKPVFTNDRSLHDRYAKLTTQRVEGSIADVIERMAAKEVLNASLGSLGMSRPQPSTRSNFPAYSTGLAMSHLIMSRILDGLPKPIHYMDTDSAFTETRRTGVMFELTDLSGEWRVPVILDDKGFGEHPLIFRSKHYYLNPDEYAIHAMQFEPKDWLRIVQTLPTETVVTRQIRGTLRTRSRKAAELQFGRWYYETLERKLPELIETFHADDKRVRETYDSYGLAREGRWIGSQAPTVTEFYEKKIGTTAETMTAPTTDKTDRRYTRDFVERWLREHAKSVQTVVWNR